MGGGIDMWLTFNFLVKDIIPSDKIFDIVFMTIKDIFKPACLSIGINSNDVDKQVIHKGIKPFQYGERNRHYLLDDEEFIDDKFTFYFIKNKLDVEDFIQNIKKHNIRSYSFTSFGIIKLYPQAKSESTDWLFREFFQPKNKLIPVLKLNLNHDGNKYTNLHTINFEFFATTLFNHKSPVILKNEDARRKNVGIISNKLKELFVNFNKVDEVNVDVDMGIALSENESWDEVIGEWTEKTNIQLEIHSLE